MYFILSSFVTVLIINLTVFAKEPASNQECQSLKNELTFLHQTLQTNSSNYNHNSIVAKNADLLYSKLLYSQCTTSDDFLKILKTYVAGYKDPHLRVESFQDLKVYNVGIFIKKFDENYIVWDYLPEIKNLKKGDELISCNNETPDQIINNTLLKYSGINNVEVFKATEAFKVFFRWDINPNLKYECRFKSSDQKIKIISLEWKETSSEDALIQRIQKSFQRPLYSIEKIQNGHYVSLSKMTSRSENDEKLIEKFVYDASTLKNSPMIVVDLRGNSGGDSTYGDRWLKTLIGYSPRLESKPDLLWSSEGNIQHFNNYIDKNFDKLNDFEKKQSLKYRKCINKEKNTFLACSDDEPKKEIFQSIDHSVKKMIVLTDEGCFSSCEIFLAKLKKIENVIHVGRQAGQSTLYGDVRNVESPSKLVSITFPQKVFFYSSDENFRKPQIVLKYNLEEEINGIDSLKKQAIELGQNYLQTENNN